MPLSCYDILRRADLDLLLYGALQVPRNCQPLCSTIELNGKLPFKIPPGIMSTQSAFARKTPSLRLNLGLKGLLTKDVRSALPPTRFGKICMQSISPRSLMANTKSSGLLTFAIAAASSAAIPPKFGGEDEDLDHQLFLILFNAAHSKGETPIPKAPSRADNSPASPTCFRTLKS